jgi:ribosomal-protein-alanine N-acetyltransferase
MIVLRTATPDDFAAMAAVHAASFAKAWTAAELSSFGWAAGGFAIVPDQVDAFVLMRVAYDEAEILTLAVAPHRRRAGLARALVKECIVRADAAGARRLMLEVSVENGPARALYDGLGFVEIGRRPRYYDQKIDAALLALAWTDAVTPRISN